MGGSKGRRQAAIADERSIVADQRSHSAPWLDYTYSMNHETNLWGQIMEHYKHTTIQALRAAFGFDINIVSSNTFDAHGEKRARYTVRRINGKKLYHAIMFPNGEIVV